VILSKIVSLFSGCGGLDMGFQMSGHKVIWANDEDDEICRVYQENQGKSITCHDISKIKTQNIPDCDILIGGPPCQAFSMIGKRSTDDKNFNLVWDFIKVLRKKQPEKFLIENVTGLRSAIDKQGDKVLDKLIKKVSELGYSVNAQVLNAADYGVPQRRKRLFLMGNLGKEKPEMPKQTHSQNQIVEGTKEWVSVEEAIGDLPRPKKEDIPVSYPSIAKTQYQKDMRRNSKKIFNHKIPTTSELDREIIKHVKEGGNYMDVPDSVNSTRIKKYKITGGRTTTYGRLNRKMPSYTINTYFSRLNVGCNIHYSQNRLITIREGLRLQSFPDTFVIPSELTKRAQYKIVGNAVPPLLSYALSKSFKS